LPVSKLPSESNQILDAVLLGDFANGSPEWHELRNEPGVIGGSDIAACAGLSSSWTSPITLWAKKTGQIPDEVTPNMSMKLGTILEEPILQLFADEHPELTILTTGTWANKTYPWMRANPDGLYLDADGNWGIVEVKFSRDYWTAVPQSYRAQVLWYMKVFGIKQAKLVALAGSSYQEYDIEWDEFEATTLFDAAVRFRQACLDLKMPDWDGSNSTLETVRALNPNIEDSEVDLDDLGVHYFNAVRMQTRLTPN
jgi:putative phage-type endonuclease